MDTHDKHVRENEPHNDQIAESLRANGKDRKKEGTRKINKLWLWLGVIVLIFILFWWLMSIGTFEALIGTTNG